MKRLVKGSYTLEASWLIPIALGIFALAVGSWFYYHDKTVLTGAVYETIVVACGREEFEEQELENFLEESVKGKLLLFHKVTADVQIEEDQVTVQCETRNQKWHIKMEQKGTRIHPEKRIRSWRMLKEKIN